MFEKFDSLVIKLPLFCLLLFIFLFLGILCVSLSSETSERKTREQNKSASTHPLTKLKNVQKKKVNKEEKNKIKIICHLHSSARDIKLFTFKIVDHRVLLEI